MGKNNEDKLYSCRKLSTFFVNKFIFKIKGLETWLSAHAYCFCREPKFGSQHPCWVAHNCNSEDLKPSSRLLGHPHS